MYPKPVQRVIELFSKFPGIGPRQASRLAFFVLKENGNFLSDLIEALSGLREGVIFCTQCYRSMEKNGSQACATCRDERRDTGVIAVVEKESDMHNLEKAGFSGTYHVLGGVISPLDQNSPKKIHLQELFGRTKNLLEKGRCEVVLATNPTTEGDTTALYIERILAPLTEQYKTLTISRLGRGLSLGSELEHVDEVTLKNALHNRK